MRPQHTLSQTVSCEGIGLHTGHPVTLTLRPAAPDTGLVFVRHGVGKSVSVKASVCNLIPTELCTAISVNGTSIKTIEDILSALVGLEVDNVYVEVDAPEVPVMDGSAAPFVQLIKAAGIVPQGRRQPFLKITKPIEVSDHGPGLPPGPVNSPSRRSIEAALYPAPVKYLYFVAGPDGRHVFSRTYNEHLRNVAESRRAFRNAR